MTAPNKKIILLKKIQFIENKLLLNSNIDVDENLIYENSLSYTLLLTNFIIFIVISFILQKSYVSPDDNYMNLSWLINYLDYDASPHSAAGQMLMWICILSIFYSGKTFYNIWYSDYYSNKIIVEKIINDENILVSNKSLIEHKLKILKYSIMYEKELSNVEFESIINLFDILISKF